MKNNEIISNLHATGISITDDELVNPEKYRDQIRHMLEYLAEHCTGITREEMGQAPFSCLSVLTYPELHNEESIPQLNSFRAVTKMMETCGIYNFSIKDFMTPNSKRLSRQLAGIINFIKFRDERLSVLSELSSTRDELSSRLHSITEQNEQLNSRLSVLREQRAEEEKAILQLEDECKGMEENICDLNLKQAELKGEGATLKGLNNTLKDSLAAASLELDEVTALRKKLSAQIVNSPERFRRQIRDVEHALQVERKDVNEAKKKLKTFSGWLTTIDEVQVDVNSALDSIHEIRSEVEKQRNSLTELDMQKQSVVSKRAALEEIDQNIHQNSRQVARADEKLQLLRRQAATRGSETQRQVEELHKRLIDAENNRVQVRAKAEKTEGESTRLEREIEAESLAQEQERNDMATAYHRLEKVVIGHLQTLRKAMEEEVSVN